MKKTQTPSQLLPGLIEKEAQLELTGVTNSSAKAWLITQTLPKLKKPWAVLWLVRNVREGEELYHQLAYWARLAGVQLPITHLYPSNLTALHNLMTNQRTISLLSLSSFHEPFPSPSLFQRSVLELAVEREIDPTELSERLVKIGYESEEPVAAPGSFGRHGGVIDVWSPQTPAPIRIEFSDRAVAGLHSVDPRTKRNLKKLDRTTIIPNRLNNTAMGATVFDWLSSERTLVVTSDPEGFAELDHEWTHFSQRLERYRRLTFHTFSTRRSIGFDFQSPKLYHRHFDQLIEDLKKLLADEYEATIITDQSRELGRLFRAKRLRQLPTFLEPPPGQTILGWLSPAEHKIILTNHEIFGDSQGQVRRTEGPKANTTFIAELRPGDFVVHLDHGIAQFTGMTVNKIDGIAKEYFSLEYAEGDRLFVPVESAEKISKYFGLAQPKLHRLSGSNWYQVTNKIREETAKIAQELLALYAQRETISATGFKGRLPEEQALADSFPYQLTPDQARVIEEVEADLARDKPMDRLVCGDVGFGKTEVAIRAAAKAVLHGKQVTVLSPTTILTQQHYDTFRKRLAGFDIKVDLLSRFRSEREQTKVISQLRTHDIDIVIGTHRLLSPDIAFRDLGLIIIDEEQRFGVRHKEQLKRLRTQAHILTLTATPIPRTLNFALSGLRDISVIETPPEGRLPIETAIKPYDDVIVRESIQRELQRKGQVYFLHNDVETITVAAERLGRLVPQAKIGIAHGQLPEDRLARAMADFDTEKTNVLVCSTIIESGLDLPNVNTLIVENSPKFGLAQLYQLRGRVGRSARQAYAYFLYHASRLNDAARKRLKALLEAKELGSGFQIALRDLEIRGTGNLLGREQHGKVAAIGLSLYSRLLTQAIDEQKNGRASRPLRDVQLDLPIEVGIPKHLVPSEPKRLKLYQQIAGLTSLKELDAFRQREFRNVDLPEPLANLFDLLKIKILSQRTDLTHLTASKLSVDGSLRERIILKFASKIKAETAALLLEFAPSWSFMGDTAKVDRAELGTDWLKTLEHIVAKLKLPD